MDNAYSYDLIGLHQLHKLYRVLGLAGKPSISVIYGSSFIVHFKIEEISIKLRSGDLGIPENPEDR